MIPARIFRTVPAETSADVEGFWAEACRLHDGWEMVTYREPLDPAEFPCTAPVWPLVTCGAQKAGLVRLELLWHHGGHYIDSDVELVRPLDTLCTLHAYAGLEDTTNVCDAVLGAEAGHPAIMACIELAMTRLVSDSVEWWDGNGPAATGPHAVSDVFHARDDVTILPREAFYPVGYWEKDRFDGFLPGPDTYGLHHWYFSWAGTPGIQWPS